MVRNAIISIDRSGLRTFSPENSTMKRRDFMKSSLIGSVGAFNLGLGASLSLGADKSVSRRPNVLFALADDWGWPHAGAYGDPVVKTPNFDRIASEGVLFTNAYISSPSCTPCRNALLTGQYHWRLGPGANLWSTLDPKTPTYPLLLKKAGYYIGSWRKSWGPGRLTGWEDHPAGQPVKKGFDAFLAARPKDTPFCFFFGTSDPHRGYAKGSGAKSGMDLSKIKLFECFPDSPEVRGDVADYYYEVQQWDRDVGKALARLKEIGELDNTIVVMSGDHGMPFPRCKANLYDSGARVPLAIRWGANIKKPGRKIDDFVNFCDMGPTFLDIAGVKIPKVMTGKSFLSLLKSDKGGIIEPKDRGFTMYGKERHCPGQEENMGGYPCRAIRVHGYLYIRNFKPDLWPSGTPNYEKAALSRAWLADCDNGPTKTYMAFNKDKDATHKRLWDLSFAKRPGEELYDCKKDPEQLTNVAADPAYAEIRKKLAAKLMENLKLAGDPRATGGGDEFDKYPFFGGGPRYPGGRKKKK
ncbi:MAG: sulfatase, partial [bacterium]|nr:sulfatase [bacterium]